MLKRLLLFLPAAGVVAAMLCSGQPAENKIVVPVTKTDPANGKQMYVNYCASCHGLNGKGNGPVAPALKFQPTDLTVLSKNNDGKFPTAHVLSVLQFGGPAHGTADMPVWGTVLASMDETSSQGRMLGVSNLRHYLETIQVK